MRLAAERALRAVALVLIALLTWRWQRAVAHTQAVPQPGLQHALLTMAIERPDSLLLALDSIPSPLDRDWLLAMRRAGTSVQWRSAKPLSRLAIEAMPLPGPDAGANLLTAVRPAQLITIADSISTIDTMTVAGITARRYRIDGTLRVRSNGVSATTSATPLARKSVIVLGAAGWETKFIVAALEEAGWAVAARMTVAPGIDVVQGQPAALDTAASAAIVAVDSTAARQLPAIAHFVEQGGGLVLLPGAAATPALHHYAAADAGPLRPAGSLEFRADDPRRALAFYPLALLRPDAIVLEQRDAAITAAARRAGVGRVVQIGYLDDWRWRMTGGGAAVDAHRAWWSSVVSSVAYRPPVPASDTRSAEPAPLASLYAALGPPVSAAIGQRATPGNGAPSIGWLIAILALLIAEWSSRRLRGVP